MTAKRMRKTALLVAIFAMLVWMPFTINDLSSFVAASNESNKTAPKTPAEQVTNEVDGLKGQIDAILDDARLDGAITGVSIRKAADGTLLYSHDGDIRVHPASNQKILTAVSALRTLGADHRFATEVWTDGNLKGKVLQENLYLKGKGDPTLMKEDLDAFAQELKEKGIDKIKGNLIGDDSWFDAVRLSTDLNWDDEPYYTAAQISALTLSPNDDYDAGTVIIDVHPGKKAGDKPVVKLTPETDYVTIKNKAETVDKNGSRSISVERAHGSNEIIISGTIPVDASRSRVWRSVWEPTGYAVDVFRKSLEKEGIQFIGKSKATVGVTPEDATLLAKQQSMPLEELLIPFMKLSNNGHGEVLAKTMGKAVHGEGSWEKGIQVMEDTLDSYGLNMDTILLRDGAGMSHKNLIPANELSKLLYEIQAEDWYPLFESVLPVAGNPDRMVGGTLRYRMTEAPAKGNVKAKTGSLTGVNTLSGYVTSKDGEKLIFSIMMNNYIKGSMTQIQDEIATALAKYEFED